MNELYNITEYNIEDIINEVKDDNKLYVQYLMLTYPHDYFGQIDNFNINEKIHKKFESVGAKCLGDKFQKHIHYHHFLKSLNNKRIKIKTDFFDIKLENKIVNFYEKYIGKSGKEELKIIETEKFNQNINYNLYSLQKYKTKDFKILDTAHPRIDVMKVKNSQFD